MPKTITNLPANVAAALEAWQDQCSRLCHLDRGFAWGTNHACEEQAFLDLRAEARRAKVSLTALGLFPRDRLQIEELHISVALCALTCDHGLGRVYSN